MKKYTVRFYRGLKDFEWRWQLIASNGRIVADSGEGYKRRVDCVRQFNLMKDVCILNLISEVVEAVK